MKRLARLAACAAVSACSGEIDMRTTAPGDPPPVASDPQTPETPRPPAPAGAFQPAPAVLRRLTTAEHAHTIAALLGREMPTGVDIEDVGAIEGFRNIGASALTVSHRAVEQLEASALAAARAVFDDAAARSAFVGCQPTAAADPCVRRFLETFGRRAWRRPLTTAELDRYVALVAKTGATDPWTGLRLATAGLLQSPHFIYRVELGERDEREPWRLRYTSWDMASRLAFFFTDAGPDDTLLDAAARGDLLTTDGLRTQAARLSALPAAKRATRRFFAELLATERLGLLTKDRKLFPAMTDTLAASMQGEIERNLDDALHDRPVPLAALLDRRETFVNAEMSKLYGLSGTPPAAWTKVTLPAGERVGLLGMAGPLAMNARGNRSSPTLRGRFIREALLCQGVPEAPPEAAEATAMFDGDVAGGKGTLRARLDQHRSQPQCAACHSLMDPLGYPLERFDAVGALRTSDGGEVLDTSGELDGRRFEGLPALAETLRAHGGVVGCLVRQLYRHAAGHSETPAEEAVLTKLAGESGGRGLLEVAQKLVTTDAFRLAMPPQ